MKQHYNIDWLIDKFENGDPLKYLFFWGHTSNNQETIDKSCFSQWFELPFIVDGIIYRTAEHWMMAKKALLFGNNEIFEKIIKAKKPGEAKELGRQIVNFNDQTWDSKRFEIVKQGNIHKFNQHSEFADYLKSTTNRILVKASPVDTIWGIGLSQDYQNINNPHNWKGLNLLGFALMEVREFLKEFGHFSELNNLIDLPWKVYPDIHPLDLFWQMGKGEEFIEKFYKYYSALSDRDKTILKLTKPEPLNWEGFYNI